MRQMLRIFLPSDQRLEDAPSGLVHDIGGGLTQLDIGHLQYLGDPNSSNTAYTARQYTPRRLRRRMRLASRQHYGYQMQTPRSRSASGSNGNKQADLRRLHPQSYCPFHP